MSIVNTWGVDDAYAAHCRTFGDGHRARVVDQLMEEMAELTAKLQQRKRGRDDVTNLEIISEVVDTVLCLEFLLRDLNVDSGDVRFLVSELAGKLSAKLEKYGSDAPKHRMAEFRAKI